MQTIKSLNLVHIIFVVVWVGVFEILAVLTLVSVFTPVDITTFFLYVVLTLIVSIVCLPLAVT